MNEEQLKQNLEAIFQYARIHSVNHNNSEEELISIIQVKKEVFERLFEKKEKNKKNNKD